MFSVSSSDEFRFRSFERDSVEESSGERRASKLHRQHTIDDRSSAYDG